jgi:hypothetical protein
MEEFHRAQWKFYKDRGFKIGTKRNYYGSTIAHLGENRDISDIYNVEPFIQYYKGRDEKIIKCDTNPELSLEFFIEFYKSTSTDNQKIILKDYKNFSGVKIKDTYMQLCDAFCSSSQEKIQFIKKMPFTMFEVNYVDLPEFDKQLQDLGLKDDALHQFYVDFLKPRKNQIKVPSTGAKVKSFLKSKYDEDKLEPFFPFFPFLQADFQEVALDIFDNQHELSTVSFVKLKTIVQKYGIKNWKTEDYKTHISNLCVGIKEYYKLNKALNTEDATSKILKIEFLHSNPNFTLDLLNDLVSQYFVSLKSNPQEPKYNKEVGMKWVLQYNLQQNLDVKVEKVKQLKI